MKITHLDLNPVHTFTLITSGNIILLSSFSSMKETSYHRLVEVRGQNTKRTLFGLGQIHDNILTLSGADFLMYANTNASSIC